MYYAYANIRRSADEKTVSVLYVGPALDEAKQLCDEALQGGAESAVVKALGQGVVYHVH